MTLKAAARNCVHGSFVFFGSIRINDLFRNYFRFQTLVPLGTCPPPINNTLSFHPQLLVYRSRTGVAINNLLPKFINYYYDSFQSGQNFIYLLGGRVLAVNAGARAPGGGVTRQGVVLSDLQSFRDGQ
jgi:hypothetical protein